MEQRAAELGAEAYDSLIQGVVLAYGVQADSDHEMAHNACEVREIERMMGAFAGELSKLDETLEVLAAYLGRMRTSTHAQSKRTLH